MGSFHGMATRAHPKNSWNSRPFFPPLLFPLFPPQGLSLPFGSRNSQISALPAAPGFPWDLGEIPGKTNWKIRTIDPESSWVRALPAWNSPLEKEPLECSTPDLWDAIPGKSLFRTVFIPLFFYVFPWNFPLIPVIPRKPNCSGFSPPVFPGIFGWNKEHTDFRDQGIPLEFLFQ